ncbi:MAG: hypothetical protein AAF968_03415 [Pseudomonadota bacterium]
MPGPFTIVDHKSDDTSGWEWGYARHPQAKSAPTPVERDFARRLAARVNMIRGFKETKVARSVMQRAKDAFSVALVRDDAVTSKDEDFLDGGDYAKELEALDGQILRELAEPALLSRIKTYFYILVPTGLLLLLAVFAAIPLVPSEYSEYKAILTTTTPYILTTFGVLLGRAISFVPLARTQIESLMEYKKLIFRHRSPFLDLFFDILVGCIAALFFINNFIVIEIGQVGGDGMGISSRKIESNAHLAVGFGVLIGIVRSEFVARLIGNARDAVAGGNN